MKLKSERRQELIEALDFAIADATRALQSGLGKPLDQKDAHTVLNNHLKLRWVIDKQEREEARLKRAEMIVDDSNLVINVINEVGFPSSYAPEQLL